MNFKMALLPPDIIDGWEYQIRETLHGAEVKAFRSPEEAGDYIEDATCAYGFVPPELFRRAKKLRWIQCYAAGRSFFLVR